MRIPGKKLLCTSSSAKTIPERGALITAESPVASSLVIR